jgi:uridine phosphorylase
MLNTHRGLWGYTGTAGGEMPVSVQSTGMGGPSAAIIVEELVELGARTLVRVGTCGALVPELNLGDLVVAGEALAQDGASRALGAEARASADPDLTRALAEAARAEPATVASTDLFYDPREEVVEQWIEAGAVAVEMESATIFRIAERHGVRAGCLLGVSDVIADGARERIDRQDLERLGVRLGEIAIKALGSAE